ncbi:tetratricopeptide repeat protein [Pseudofulvibacter geojedonensis]|uniref:Tetratricopeptide repeat protein n=1 Tax=Pseudofulvibacter geojedonensis TaxID=1123758 RepID=A0ABW3I4W5_9FLAO
MRLFLIILLIPLYSWTQNFQEAIHLFESKKLEAAKSVFKKISEDNANYIKAQEYLGDIAAYQKKWDVSLGYYKKLLDIDNNNAVYNYKYGGVLAYKAQSVNKLKALTLVSDIKKHLHKAAELDNQHIEVRWALVEVYISLPGIVGGSEKKAKKYANELMHISPVDGYLALGYVAEYNDKPQIAEENYKKAIELGGSLHTYDKLSGLYEKTNQPKKAISNYEKASEKHKRNHLNYQIGKVCAQYNMYLDKGLICLNEYIKNHSPKDGVPISWANYRIAQIYRYKKDKRNAYNFIEKALREKPDLEPALKEKKMILLME